MAVGDIDEMREVRLTGSNARGSTETDLVAIWHILELFYVSSIFIALDKIMARISQSINYSTFNSLGLYHYPRRNVLSLQATWKDQAMPVMLPI